MHKCYKVGITIFVNLTLTYFSYAESLKEYFISHDTFMYFYSNIDKIRTSKAYTSIDKYLIKNNCTEYSRLLKITETIGITEGNISEVYLASSLKNVNTTADVSEKNVYFTAGIILKQDTTIDRLLGVFKEYFKGNSYVKIVKKQQDNTNFINLKMENSLIYVTVLKNRIILVGNDMSDIRAIIKAYENKKTKITSSKTNDLLNHASLSNTLYVVIVIPPFMTKELRHINSKTKCDEKQDVKFKINSALQALKGLEITTNLEDNLTIKIDVVFTNQEDAKSFNTLVDQFLPLLKIQLFLMVKNTTLPVLNTIFAKIINNSVSISAILTSDDFISINQMIKNKGNIPGF